MEIKADQQIAAERVVRALADSAKIGNKIADVLQNERVSVMTIAFAVIGLNEMLHRTYPEWSEIEAAAAHIFNQLKSQGKLDTYMIDEEPNGQ